VRDADTSAAAGTSWSLATAFYWGYLWRFTLVAIGMCLPFIIIVPILKLAFGQWRLFFLLLLLMCVVAACVLASCIAIKWAAESRFGGCLLQFIHTRRGSEASQTPIDQIIPPAAALKLFLAHVWRYLIAVVPLNLALICLLLGPHALAAADLATNLKVQCIDFPADFVVGIWAMKQALDLTYAGFRFQWVAARP